jgi:dTDP-glucose 4,6-dehydratase
VSPRPRREPRCVLVTGGAGFIGSAFIRHLLNEVGFGGHVVNLDLLTYAGNLENIPLAAEEPRYTFVRGDIRDQAVVEAICIEHDVDVIVNFAAESHVDRSIHGPAAFVETNIVGTFHLLEVVRRRPSIHFHHVSTDEVYGSLGAEGLFTETSPYQPNSPYAASKAASDHLVRAYAHTYGLSVTLSNCSNNYGPYQFPEKLIPLMILNMIDGKPLPVYGDGSNVRDWLYVDDHAEAIWTIIGAGASGETYNVGGEAERTNLEMVRALIDCYAELKDADRDRLRESITFVKDRPGHDQRYAIDGAKIHRELGWRPRYELESGLRSTVKWYLDSAEWIERVKSGAYRDWIDTNYGSR